MMATLRHRRITGLIALVAPALLSAGLLVASAVPAQAIVVSNRSPVDGASSVPVGTNVSVMFDVAATGVNATSFTLAPSGGAPVAASVTANATDTSFTLDPTADLQHGTTYTATLSSAIVDVDGRAFLGTSWQFTTATATPVDTTAPTVISRSPGVGAIGVAALQTVTVEFSEEVQGVNEFTFTLQRNTGATVPAAVFRRGATNRWSLNPDDPLADNARFTVRLDGGPAAIRDLAGNALADTSWSFRTGGGVDTVGPQVLSRFPRPGEVGVNRFSDVRVRFSEAVRGVDTDTFILTNTRTGNDVRATVTQLGGSRQWVLEPNRALRAGTRYVARLFGGAAGIQDVNGNALRTTTWTFRTRF